MTKPDFAPHFLEGIEHFNTKQFWHAHESWEALWLEAIRLFDAALRRMEPFPNPFCGIDRGPAVEAAGRDRHALTGGGVPEQWKYPSLVLLSPDVSPMPPRDDW
jgi:DUF309 family protein family protein